MGKILKRGVLLALALVTALMLLPMAKADAAALKQGSRGSEVKQLQMNLIGLGFLEGDADGSFGTKTKAAVQAFQEQYGLKVDGSAGIATQVALRSAIIRLQVELDSQGYQPGSADGYFGSRTQNALKSYQRDQGLEATGIAASATWAKLNADSVGLRAGVSVKSGAQVKYMQQALIGLGFLNGTADGSYGPKTREAVKKYQSTYGLDADGSAGPCTMTSLKNTVVALQSDLSQKGFYSGKIDSLFGGGTRDAVKAYQKKTGITVTGLAGVKTMQKLNGFAMGGSDDNAGNEKTYKIWIDPLYQDGDYSKIWYQNAGKKSTTVHKSGCGGVSLAMALNALLETDKYTGQNVMQWYADNGYYYGNGTYQDGILKYPRKLGLKSTYCDSAKDLVSHLKQDRLAVALIKDKTGDAFFTYPTSGGHFVLISGYRVQDGVEQIFVNNPLSYKASKWYDLEDLMDNVLNDWNGYANSFVVVYK